jgi:hypothetical protein
LASGQLSPSDQHQQQKHVTSIRAKLAWAKVIFVSLVCQDQIQCCRSRTKKEFVTATLLQTEQSAVPNCLAAYSYLHSSHGHATVQSTNAQIRLHCTIAHQSNSKFTIASLGCWSQNTRHTR